jgi:hypothetical protein
MNQTEIDTLDKCIDRLNDGLPVEECINQSANLTAEMIDILKTTNDLMSLGKHQVSADQMKKSLKLLLTQAEKLKTEKSQSDPKPTQVPLGVKVRQFLQGGSSLRPLINRMTLVLGITALLILLSGGLVITSAKSLPGDSLYPVKRAVEDFTVHLLPSREIKHEYEENYSQQRVDEISRLIALNRIQRISFEGVLEDKTLSRWIVNGIPVSIQPDTTFEGELKGTESFLIGSVVEVEGVTNSQGGVSATEIKLKQYLFTGTVEKIDKNSWQISGINLSITPQTRIEQEFVVGDEVSVVIASEDGVLYALSIQSTATQVTTPYMLPTEHPDIETEEPISTTEMEHSEDSNETNQDEPQVTAEPSEDGEHEGSGSVESTDNHDSDNHRNYGTTTPTPEEHE